MYTRCSECETLFRVTREQLNAARGQVRCGRCGSTFDALANLREEIILPQPEGVAEEQVESGSESTDELEMPAPLPPAPDVFELLAPSGAGRKRWPWVVAGVALTLVVIAQVVHFQRDRIVDNTLIGQYISSFYDAIGRPVRVAPVYDLSAFALLHHELVTHPHTRGALHLSGVLSNGADFAQPWPVLELRLEDRFGDPVAARRLEPAEYLRTPPAGNELMPTHARRAIEIALVDPGEDAVGFSIDFCVRLRDGLRCTTHN